MTQVPDISVLLADDEPLVRAGLAMLIDSEPGLRVAGEAGDGAEAVRVAREIRPDVVVMDVRMPGMDGVEATRLLVGDDFISATGFTVAVLVLTTFNDDQYVHRALRAGASGYMLKNVAPRLLADAIRAVAAGDAWLHPSVTRDLLAEFATTPDLDIPPPTELHRLTVRETEVLTLVAHGMSNPEIARHLVISDATVKTHLSRLMNKLDLRDRAQAVAMAYKTGLVHPHDRPPSRRRADPPGPA